MSDYIVRATAADSQIRAFAITSRSMTEEARKRHNCSPVVTAALGRLMSAAAMMGSMMKGEKDLLTLQLVGDGPMRGLTVTADAAGHVKGYPEEPAVILPPNAAGKLNVGGAIGQGMLSVIKDLGLKDPYVGQTALQTGEIAEDLTYYFAVSEQVPSSVGLGVLMNKDNTVRQAGGFIIQLMPYTEDSVIDRLEKKITEISSVTEMLEQGMSPEEMLEYILEGFEPEILNIVPAQFRCDCSRERISRALASLSKKEMDSIIQEDEPIEVKCHFCNTDYTFQVEELKKIREKGSRGNAADRSEEA